MPKVVAHSVTWIAAQNTYVIHEPGRPDSSPVPGEEQQWFTWLAACSSFAFQGKQGHLTLRKEARARNAGYWYAYRCQNRKTIKRYAGRTTDLAITRLEEIAGEISAAFATARPPQEAPELDPEPSATSPLLAPKLRLPHLHSSLVARERLLARLDACLERKLTMLCAPAGSGKTTLVRQWIAARSEQVSFPPVSWVSLDAGDNDPTRFWRYILASSQAWHTTPDQHALNLLLSSTQPYQPYMKPPTLEVALTTFLNEVTQRNIAGLLILEDYHVIVEARIHETLDFFLSHLPETLHVVLITRQEPPLPLARLRANGDLNEIQAADLRFTSEESAAFLQEFALSTEALARLDTHLEGWAAGLRLLFLSLQGKTTQPQIERLLATFSGSHRPILDYFVAEVLHAQPERLQDFLLRTSVLPRLSPSLCTAVTGMPES
ncbi:MAG: LuxR family transcriptional regulator, partial [Ktedonobacteraceae bacterium]|nr:LuxR family transcriptional regulator [Ktedonobacteraceae bacterium]